MSGSVAPNTAPALDPPAVAPSGAPASDRQRPLGTRFKLIYGAGAVVDGVSNAALTYFLLFYLTTVCGMSGTQAGAALLVGLLIDAAIDPVIGLWSDNLRSRWGRRLPFMLAGFLPLATCFALIFSIPAWVTGTGLFVYATVLAIALRMAGSVFLLPYIAVGAEVSDDYQERSSIVAYRISFTMLGTFLTIALGLGVFMSGATGLQNRAAYVPFGWSCAALIVLAGVAAGVATRSVRHRLHDVEPGEGMSFAGFRRDFTDVFRNRSFVVLFLAVLAFFVGQGMSGALQLHLNRYFWGLSAAQVQLVLIGVTVGPLVGAPVTALLARRFEKKQLAIGSFLLFVVCQIWPPIARVAGLLSGTGSEIVAILVCNAFLAGAALVGGAICAQSMMADAVDEHEYLFGFRREGLFFSGLTLAVKAASGLGGFLAGTALDLVHFPASLAAKGGALNLTPDVARNLGLTAALMPGLITMLAPAALMFYALSREKHSRILARLAARSRAGPADGASPSPSALAGKDL